MEQCHDASVCLKFKCSATSVAGLSLEEKVPASLPTGSQFICHQACLTLQKYLVLIRMKSIMGVGHIVTNMEVKLNSQVHHGNKPVI